MTGDMPVAPSLALAGLDAASLVVDVSADDRARSARNSRGAAKPRSARRKALMAAACSAAQRARAEQAAHARRERARGAPCRCDASNDSHRLNSRSERPRRGVRGERARQALARGGRTTQARGVAGSAPWAKGARASRVLGRALERGRQSHERSVRRDGRTSCTRHSATATTSLVYPHARACPLHGACGRDAQTGQLPGATRTYNADMAVAASAQSCKTGRHQHAAPLAAGSRRRGGRSRRHWQHCSHARRREAARGCGSRVA